MYNRASEAKRFDGVLVDTESMRIQSASNYDFARHFGDPQDLFAARAAEIDRALRLWLKLHPEGTVVSLGRASKSRAGASILLVDKKTR